MIRLCLKEAHAQDCGRLTGPGVRVRGTRPLPGSHERREAPGREGAAAQNARRHKLFPDGRRVRRVREQPACGPYTRSSAVRPPNASGMIFLARSRKNAETAASESREPAFRAIRSHSAIGRRAIQHMQTDPGPANTWPAVSMHNLTRRRVGVYLILLGHLQKGDRVMKGVNGRILPPWQVSGSSAWRPASPLQGARRRTGLAPLATSVAPE